MIHLGQLMATPPGFSHPLDAGSILFHYIWGEYRRNNSALYVNSGVGNWFPIRVNATPKSSRSASCDPNVKRAAGFILVHPRALFATERFFPAEQ